MYLALRDFLPNHVQVQEGSCLVRLKPWTWTKRPLLSLVRQETYHSRLVQEILASRQFNEGNILKLCPLMWKTIDIYMQWTVITFNCVPMNTMESCPTLLYISLPDCPTYLRKTLSKVFFGATGVKKFHTHE